MSILICGMEMPTTPVLFCIHPDGKVFTDLEGGWREYKAIPVPPHGRLIDADALCKTLRSLAENEYTPEVFANWIENHIDTIIPAESEEEEMK